jgi:hypothetical protein
MELLAYLFENIDIKIQFRNQNFDAGIKRSDAGIEIPIPN